MVDATRGSFREEMLALSMLALAIKSKEPKKASQEALLFPRKNLKIFGKELEDGGVVNIGGMSIGDMVSKAYNALPNNPFKGKNTSRCK